MVDAARFLRGIDQGELDPRHEKFTAEFIAARLKEDGAFSPEKASALLEELRAFRGDLEHDVRETEISERILRDVLPQRKAEDKGYKQSVCRENPVLKGYDEVVLPRAEAVVAAIQAGRPDPEIEAAAQDFLRAYFAYYAPNTLRTHWNMDNQTPSIIPHVFVPWRYKKDDPECIEASNLVVEEGNQARINACLGKALPAGHHLSPAEVAELKLNGFDLSLLNPGVSGYWRRRTVEEVEAERAALAPRFPRPEEKLTYEAPRYRSVFSTKLTASFVRDGKVHRLKIKLGPEVHPEAISSRLRANMGFPQDQNLHRDEITLHLGSRTYDQFERELGLKYGVEQLRRVIARRGADPRTGEEWVVFKDSLLCLRPEDELRVAIHDQGAWDGANRREERTQFLLNAFLGVGDTLPHNHRVVMRRNPEGEMVPEYRFQDVGTSLGVTTVLQRPRDALNFGGSKNKIEDYDRDFIKKNKHGDISIVYNDYFRHVRDNRDVTYSDLKWMARVITGVPEEAIRRAIVEGGIPPELIPVYHYHLVNMRNRLIRAFDLDASEDNLPGKSPAREYELPPLESINEGEAVKRGKIVSTYYPGKMIMPIQQQTWVTLVNQLLSLAGQKSFSRQLEQRFGTTYGAAIGPLVTTNNNVHLTLLNDRIPPSIGKLSLQPGVNVSIARVVTPNACLFSADGKGNPYCVHDSVSFSIGASSPFYRELISFLGPSIAASVQLFRITFEQVHYAERVKDGYLSRPRIQNMVFADTDRYAVTELGPGEVMRCDYAAGLSLSGKAQVNALVPQVNLPILENGLNGSLSWVKSGGTTYAKDTWGALHLLLERDTQSSASLGVDVLKVNLLALQAALASGYAAKSSTAQSFWNLEVVPARYALEGAGSALSSGDVEGLVEQVRAARAHPEITAPDHPRKPEVPDVRLRLRVKARQEASLSRGQGLFFFNADRSKQKTRLRIESDTDVHDLLRLARGKRALAGIEQLLINSENHNILVRNGTSKKLTLELDRANPRNFVLMLDVFDYHHTLKQAGVLALIDELNRRYSRAPDAPFFRKDIPEVANAYKKIYANTRIYVNGPSVLALVEELDLGALEARIAGAIGGAVRRRDKLGDLTEPLDRRLILKKARRSARALRRAAESLRAFGPAGEGTDPRRAAAEERLAKAAFAFVYALYKSKYGVSVLRDLLGDDGMMVIGELFGIHHQTNTLQEDFWKNTLRFMGQSWGKLNKVPPVSRYVRYEQPMTPHIYAPPGIPLRTFVGDVVTGMPGNYIGFGAR